MKLIFCNECHDVIRLYKTTRSCLCGESGGHYKEDGLYAVIHGNCQPLGFANDSFRRAREEQLEFGAGTEFTSFVIPVVCPTITHVDSKDYVTHIQQVIEFRNRVKGSKKKNNEIKNVFKDEE